MTWDRRDDFPVSPWTDPVKPPAANHEYVWCIAPSGELCRTSTTRSLSPPFIRDDDGNLQPRPGHVPGWLLVADELPAEKHAAFLAFQAIADKYRRQPKPDDFPAVDPVHGVPVELVPAVCRERRAS